MALSESGLLAQGVMPGPMIYGPKGQRMVVKPTPGPAPSGKMTVRGGRKQNLYVKPRGKGR